MRIALVTGNLHLGGTTTFLLNLCSEFVARGVPHRVICLEANAPMYDDFVSRNIPVERIPPGRRIFEDQIAFGIECCRALQATHVVACLSPTSFEVARHTPACCAARLAMVQSDDSLVYQALEPYGRYFSAAVGVSKWICQRIRSTSGLSHLSAYYQPYGIAIPPVAGSGDPVRASIARPLRILYLGRLYREQKRVHLFPQILQDLIAADIAFEWTICGDGEERGWLESCMRTQRSDQRVVFSGQVDYSEIPGILAGKDVLLLASDYEGLPLSLLEAMAQGLVPVVSNIASGVSEVVAGDCGFLVPVDEVSGYAEKLVWLANNRAALHEMGLRARQRVIGFFSKEAMADRWIEMLEHLAPVGPAVWPGRIAIRQPLLLKHLLRSHPVFRPLRRLKVKLAGAR